MLKINITYNSKFLTCVLWVGGRDTVGVPLKIFIVLFPKLMKNKEDLL